MPFEPEKTGTFDYSENRSRSTRRAFLRSGAAGVVAATLGGSNALGDALSDAAPESESELESNAAATGAESAAETEESAVASESKFPYHLDGCESFAEYKAKRKQAGLPCDAVVVAADDPALVRDPNRCANCGRCDEACMSQSISHWYDRATLKPGVETICTRCGQCVASCKFNVLHERLQYGDVWDAIDETGRESNKERKTTFVATVAPALRVSLGEALGLEPGVDLERLLPATLKELGFDFVLDATFGADLTAQEESAELLERLESSDRRPLFTSCCPAWVVFVETFYPEFLPLLSTTRSPLLAQGAAIKTKFAKARGLDPASITNVAFVPCVGKKFEAARPEANASGRFVGRPEVRDLDFALTTRELASWVIRANVDPSELREADFDSTVGVGSGAGRIFGASGGVAESTLRALWRRIETAEGRPDSEIPARLLNLKETRGLTSIRSTTVEIGGKTIRVAVVCGLAAARGLLETLKTTGELEFDFVEVMACPGGCVGGGGQPKRDGMLKPTDVERGKRANALFANDGAAMIRVPGDNPELRALYADFDGAPLGDRVETLFHTAFQKRDVWR